MHLWLRSKWKKIYCNLDVRTGLRLRCDKEVAPEVRKVCIEFCKWLRTEYYFPIRVPIYMKATETKETGTWTLCNCNSFCLVWSDTSS